MKKQKVKFDERQIKILFELQKKFSEYHYPLPVKVFNLEKNQSLTIQEQVKKVQEKIEQEYNSLIWDVEYFDYNEKYTFGKIIYIPLDETMEDHILLNTIDLSQAPGLTVEFALQRFKYLANPVIMDYELDGQILKIKYVLHKQEA